MQNHAPDACMAVSAKMAGFSGIFSGLPGGQFSAFNHVIMILCRGVFFTAISPRSRVRPESGSR